MQILVLRNWETYRTRYEWSIIKLDRSRIGQFVFRNSALIYKTSKGELIARKFLGVLKSVMEYVLQTKVFC